MNTAAWILLPFVALLWALTMWVLIVHPLILWATSYFRAWRAHRRFERLVAHHFDVPAGKVRLGKSAPAPRRTARGMTPRR